MNLRKIFPLLAIISLSTAGPVMSAGDSSVEKRQQSSAIVADFRLADAVIVDQRSSLTLFISLPEPASLQLSCDESSLLDESIQERSYQSDQQGSISIVIYLRPQNPGRQHLHCSAAAMIDGNWLQRQLRMPVTVAAAGGGSVDAASSGAPSSHRFVVESD